MRSTIMNKLFTKFILTALTAASMFAGTAAFAENTITARAILDLHNVISFGTDNESALFDEGMKRTALSADGEGKAQTVITYAASSL